MKDEQVLYIRNSNRFGEKIAKPLQTLCIEDNHQLIGNEEVPSIKPIIIAYEDPLSVLPKYAELLNSTLIPEMDNRSVLEIANKERQEDPLHRVNVKACGWVGKKGANDQKRFIESYFPAFERKNARLRTEGDSFNDFILKKEHRYVKDYVISIIQGILKFLDLCDIRNGNRRYTKASLLEFLSANNIEQKENFLKDVMNWALLIINSNSDNDIQSLKEAIYQYMTTTILPLYGKSVTRDAHNFFNIIGEGIHEAPVAEHGNIYHGDKIDIEVATVHSVKGETHAATLYLETFYDRHHESDRLSEQFKGIAYTRADKKVLSSLRVIYVGMSRPRYLLCVAIQKDRFDNTDCRELREIWDVVKV